jgi:hypothetical protein
MGEVTKIDHVYGNSQEVVETGDLIFNVGAILKDVAKGWPGVIHQVNKSTYLDVFGTPPRLAEDAYQAYYALYINENTLGEYIRVVASDAKYAHLTYATLDGARTEGASAFDTAIEPVTANQMVAWVKDGVTDDDKYGIAITSIDATKKTFVVEISEKQADATVVLLGSYTVNFIPGSVNANNEPLFIESVFASKCPQIGIKVAEDADFDKVVAHTIEYFTGGLPGGDPVEADYLAAWSLLNDEEIDLDMIFTAGNTESTHLTNALSVALTRMVRIEIDNPAGQTVAAAIAWLDGLSLQSELYCWTYGRVSFNDPFYPGIRKSLGVSGFAVAAKAYGMNASRTLIDPGVEEAPAGEEFGLIRGVTGIRNETPLSAANKVLIAAAWGNYIVNSSNSGIIFWEQYTLFGEESKRAYKRTVDVISYIYHNHKDALKVDMFRGKTNEQIIHKLSKVMERLKGKKVLVASTDTGTPYPEAYRIWITQVGAKRQIHRAFRVSWAVGPIVLETIAL